MNKKAIRVVAAVIEREGKILIGQRKDAGPRFGKWEFPGGKVRPDESEEVALIREIEEEHGVSVTVKQFISEVVHDYGDLLVHVRFYACQITEAAEVLCRDHQAIAWVRPEEIELYDFLEADRPFLAQFRKR